MGNPKSVDRSGWSSRYQLRAGTAQILIHLSHAMTVGVSSADPVSVSLVDPADIVTPNPSNLVSWLYTPAWTHFICLPKVCRFEAQAPHALLLQCCMLPSIFVHLQGLIYKHGPYKSLWICHEICDSGLTRMLITLEQLEYVSVPSSLLSGNLCLGVCYK